MQVATRSPKQTAKMKKIKASVPIGVKAGLTVVAALDYVHGNTRHHDARASWHP